MDRKTLKKVIISVVIVGSALAYLLYNSGVSSWVYYYSVDEFVTKLHNDGNEPSGSGGVVRLAGLVKAGSIVRNEEKMQLDFELAGHERTVPVRFYGIVPKNLEEGREVVVEGKLDADSVFKADKILTRCESKYKSRW